MALVEIKEDTYLQDGQRLLRVVKVLGEIVLIEDCFTLHDETIKLEDLRRLQVVEPSQRP